MIIIKRKLDRRNQLNRRDKKIHPTPLLMDYPD